MGRNRVVARSPRYMTRFACVGSACEENCCHGWSVSIDKATFTRYRDSKDPELAERFRQHIERRKGSGNPTRDYARIKLADNLQCPFLAADALCDIQSRLGAKSLSSTCAHYPRHYLREHNEVSAFATLSCPEAARQALLFADAMDLVEHPLDAANVSALPMSGGVAADIAERGNLQMQAKQMLREAALSILRNPIISAVDALILIGLLTKRVAAGVESEDGAAIVASIRMFTAPETIAHVSRWVGALVTDCTVQMLLLKEITVEYLLTVRGRPSFVQHVTQALSGFAYSDDDVAGSRDRYREAAQHWFCPFDQAHPHLLKNYLINEVSKSLFPFPTREIEDQYFDMAIRFGMIQMYLVGLSGKLRDGFSEKAYVGIIYTFCRNIEHNESFMPHVLDLLRDNGFLNMATIATLLRT